MAWKEIELKNEMWKPEKEGDTLQGVVIDIEKNQYGNSYVITTEDGEEFKTPAHKILQKLMEDIKKGQVVKIEFKEEKDTNKGNPLQIYKVFVWENEEKKVNQEKVEELKETVNPVNTN